MRSRLLLFSLMLGAALPATAMTKAKEAPPIITAAKAPEPHSEDDDIPDSIGALTLRPMPEPSEDLPPFLRQAEYLRKYDDNTMAASYLKSVVNNPDVLPRDRAQGILELADCLDAVHRPAEELAWLRIWLQLFPARQEAGAVAYRTGTLYTRMGLSSLARDAFYRALSVSINQGEVQNAEDLKRYSRLTIGTLWALASNEYRAGDWDRAAELFERYRREAPTAEPATLHKAAFLVADCYYQSHQNDKAVAAYQQALKDHPFHPLAPEARLRLYQLDMINHQPAQAQQELEALIWTVRTAYPKTESYWQARTAETLLALNSQNDDALPPLLKVSARLSSGGKAWQHQLDHYNQLANLREMTTQPTMAAASSHPDDQPGMIERDDLLAMSQSIAELAPLPFNPPTHP